MFNILVLTGKSTSGKDTLAKELINNHGYQRLVTYTSRPKRDGEVDGVDYHFTSTQDFLEKINNDFFLEFRFYSTEFGIWYYGSSVLSYQEATDKTIAILTPSGIKKLKEYNIPHTSVYINVSDEVIKQRQIERNDDKSEALRRFNSDKRDFESIESQVDYIINNENRDIRDVAREIEILYRKEHKKNK